MSCICIGTGGSYTQTDLVIGMRYALHITAYLELSDGTKTVYREPNKYFVSGTMLHEPEPHII